ncbi:hypothetical protein PFFVO_06023, partial [Plasmodium falciparum Vietnam Oak-Knoll (FVO)]
MVPPGGRQGGSGEDGIDDKDAKHVLDEIGEKVYKEKVKKDDAKTYKEALKGNLASATNRSVETLGTIKTCDLVEEYRRKNTGTADAHGDPCKKDTNGNDVDRFSVKQQAEYDNKKIKCSYGKNEGACAPFRRLHLCNKNMEKIATSTTSDTLLAEVCYAAKYEGQTIARDYPKYQQKYVNSGSTICTVLARSFADIGDI